LNQSLLRPDRLLAAPLRAVGVEEGRLRDVLGVGRVAEDGERVAVDVARVAAVEPLERFVDRGIVSSAWLGVRLHTGETPRTGARILLGRSLRPPFGRDVDRPAERDETRLLD